jgi:hypothetical protein
VGKAWAFASSSRCPCDKHRTSPSALPLILLLGGHSHIFSLSPLTHSSHSLLSLRSFLTLCFSHSLFRFIRLTSISDKQDILGACWMSLEASTQPGNNGIESTPVGKPPAERPMSSLRDKGAQVTAACQRCRQQRIKVGKSS